MKHLPSVDVEMLGNMLDALSFSVYTFDRERRVMYSNTAARKNQASAEPGSFIGAAEPGHFDVHQYFNEARERIPPEDLLIIDRAFKGIPTRELLIEHRDMVKRTHQWLEVTCVPVMDEDGEFSYGILVSRELSLRKKREEKLRFLLESMKILSITMDFKDRLQRKAELAVPALADWCSIEIVTSDNKIERQALVHREPAKIQLIREYEKLYPPQPGEETATQRVIRTGKGEFTPLVTKEMIDAVPNLKAEQREAIYKLELSSIIILPIGIPGKTLGALTLAYAESNRAYTEDDFTFFTEFAQHLYVILDNARLYDEIRLRDESKDIFLASLSHELRNPLAPIRSSLELLRIQNKDSTLDPELQVLEHQFSHMSRLLNDLLDTTRFIRGKIVVQLNPIELADVMQHVVQALRTVAEKKNIDLSVVSDRTSYIVNADRTRLEQAFTNLLNNAIKFTPPGGKITVTITVEDQQLILKVRDTGVGITSEEMARIFEPYYQSERVQNANTGLGIGLRLVYEIVHLHNGTITVASEGKDMGSEFTITMPLMAASTATQKDAEPESFPTATTKKVIIVDDNEAAADGLVRLLKALGWDAQALYSGRDLLIHLEKEMADIVFVDIGMPEMDGYDVIEEIRTRNYTLPVVALTGYGLTEDKQEALSAGFTAHLTKPIGAAELKATLEELL